MLQVTKRDGSKEPLDIEKIHKVVIWATEDLTGVSASEVEIKSQIQFYNNIKTTDIHETLIKAAAELISEDTPNYQYVAGRLINIHLRKEVYGQFTPTSLFDLISKNVKLEFYDSLLLTAYSEQEWRQIEHFVDHDRDMALTYAAMEQFRGKYLVQNRVTRRHLETPQVAYALIAATLFASYPHDTRMGYVKDYYQATSRHDISLPTPVMAGVRTQQRQFSSCVLIETDDSLDSISATSAAIVRYVSQKAGIGVSAGRIRALGSKVRNGDTRHTGVTPFLRLFQSSIDSCSQGSVRKGSGTIWFAIFHLEIEDILVLKNNKGSEDNRVRRVDYGIQFNRLFYERFIQGGDITLFSPHDVPEMFEAFFNDYALFKTLYEEAEQNPNLRKKTVKAIDLFSSFMQERKDTGRIYLQNVDNANTHSSFIESMAPVRQSNLCAEITLHVSPLNDINDGATARCIRVPKHRHEQFLDYMKIHGNYLFHDGKHLYETVADSDQRYLDDYVYSTEEIRNDNGAAIALCTLSAINWGNIKDPSDFERPCRLAVRALDALLGYQSYPVKAAHLATLEHRPLGVGIINLAYWLAKNDLRYSDGSALEKLDEYAEAWSYYLIRASVDLAIEKGACINNHQTKYGLGLMPIDTRKRDVDMLVPHIERMPWNELREDAKRYGIRNATLMALMPSETSAQISNATNGIEPPRAYISVKQSNDGILKQVVPEYRKLKNKYELLWDQRSPEGYLNVCAVLQKYIDQAISVNTSYNPQYYENEKIPMSEMLGHVLHFYKMGGKNLYYFQTMDGQGEVDISKMATDEEVCESCTI